MTGHFAFEIVVHIFTSSPPYFAESTTMLPPYFDEVKMFFAKYGGIDVETVKKIWYSHGRKEVRKMWLEHLRAMKQQANISTKELAALSKIPETTLEKIFAGATKDPRLQTVSGIVHALGYTLDDLYPETGITAPSPNLQKVTASMEAMNEDGQSRVVDYADDLVQSGKYNKNASV